MSNLLAQQCVAKTLSSTQVELLLHPNQTPLLNPNSQERLTLALKNHFGPQVKVSIQIGNTEITPPALQKERQQQAQKQQTLDTLNQDANIQALLSTFDAKIEL